MTSQDRRQKRPRPAAGPLLKVIVDRPESHGRALTKAVSWRAIGTADTFLWSWLITGEVGAAGAIASLETVTKIGLYYLHERVWRVLPGAPNARTRSLIKAFSWRAVGSLDTFLLSLLVTRNGGHAAMIALAELVTKVLLYYLHERAWRRVAWGRLDAPPSEKAEQPGPAPTI